MSIENQHQEMVRALVKPGEEILKTLTAEKVDLLHAALGMANEIGELVGAVKGHVIYGKPLDMPNVIEEVGDLEFYFQQFRENPLIQLTRSKALWSNMEKLAKRYKGFRYSDQAALAREDKKMTGETDNKTV